MPVVLPEMEELLPPLRAGLIKKFLLANRQPYDTSVSCGCLFAIFRRKIDFPDEIVMHVDPMDTVAAGFVKGMGHDFIDKLMQKRGGQYRGFRVLLQNLQKALDNCCCRCRT